MLWLDNFYIDKKLIIRSNKFYGQILSAGNRPARVGVAGDVGDVTNLQDRLHLQILQFKHTHSQDILLHFTPTSLYTHYETRNVAFINWF